MRLPLISWGAEGIRRAGIFIVAMLKAWLGIPVEIVNAFVARQDGLVARINECGQAADRTVEAKANCNYRKGELIRCVRRLASELKLACGNNARAPLYRFFFPKGLPAFTRSTIESVVVQVQELHTKIALDGCPPSVAPFAEPLASLRSDLEQAVQALKGCQEDEAQAKIAYENEKLLWIEAYAQLYHRLRAHFATQPELAETFFPAPRIRRRSSEEALLEGATASDAGNGNGSESTSVAAAQPPAAA
ncbi:MAG: hypothetical protein ACE15D_09860 [Candidatus Eisenbacteria bacterium]